jgi:hypothetical protein
MVQHNTEACLHSHCCCGKAISIPYSECIFVALVIQQAMRMRRIFICGLSGPTVFFHIHTQHNLKKKVIEHKMCVLISSASFVWKISYSKNNSMRYYHKYT